jgi:hypothetical protein
MKIRYERTRYRIVGQEQHGENALDVRVCIDNLANVDDQADDKLSHPVARSCLSGEQYDTRVDLDTLLGRHGLYSQIAMNDTEDVERLPLVFLCKILYELRMGQISKKADMYTFNLDSKHSFRLHSDAQSSLDMPSETFLVVGLSRGPFLLECRVVLMLKKSFEELEILEPGARSKRLSDQIAQGGIALVQPATVLISHQFMPSPAEMD